MRGKPIGLPRFFVASRIAIIAKIAKVAKVAICAFSKNYSKTGNYS